MKIITKSIDSLRDCMGESRSFTEAFVSPCVATNQQAAEINLHALLCPCALSLSLSPDDLSSVSLSRFKPQIIDWDPTGRCRDKINKESVAMSSSLAHPNMKGRKIICQTWGSAMYFFFFFTFNKLPQLFPSPQEFLVSTLTCLQNHCIQQQSIGLWT